MVASAEKVAHGPLTARFRDDVDPNLPALDRIVTLTQALHDRQKLNEVYQWRNGVFSRTRDGYKATPLSEKDILALSASPENGGLVVSYRAVPYFFKSLPR